MTPEAQARWNDALAAASLFAVDPAGLQGLAVMAGAGPVRDLWFAHLCGALPPDAAVRRLPAGIEDDRLIGAVDLPATLASGRPVLQKGILAEADGGIVVIPMAERLPSGVAARVAMVLDQRELVIEREGIARRVPSSIGVVAFDESVSPDERLPPALGERLAFLVDLRGLGLRDLACPPVDPIRTTIARKRLAATAPDRVIDGLVATADALGLGSVVLPLLALRAARAAAALAGRDTIDREDAALAVRLVLGPRAQTVPMENEENDGTREPQQDDNGQRRDPPPPSTDDDCPAPDTPQPEMPDLEDILLAAAKAALPEDLLDKMRSGAAERQPASRSFGAGSPQLSMCRGRPAGVRHGAPRSGSRLALVETLRAAAPWQPMRRAEARAAGLVPSHLAIRSEDFRIKKFAHRRQSTIVFCVDASGSTAFHRLAETKGAVELLLAEAYITRTSVALVAFRGKRADLLLPPTRSLSRAKSLLAKLPGGGGTPLAAGIETAVLTAMAERAKGHAPLIVLLTDGHANIGRDGQARRPHAMDDALAAARRLKEARLAAVFVDTAPRPREEARRLAGAMQARYIGLPYVEASMVRDVAIAATAATRDSGPIRIR
ncbi:magnesium chelatase subunit D [Telmatospirillum siberiense]|uniref:Magnesium chelatase ATPase subunit D n=1 Tax=Telmatospirillum siberiense TaxID=382514 RepID=A0A2N3PTE6_9PROT|nr:magnesium chelatase subunit D [Telmatospirillum siberiense]PKU23667.1 magnesium chelatase ATPase subunit D [Telmatospirillum siberiense]